MGFDEGVERDFCATGFWCASPVLELAAGTGVCWDFVGLDFLGSTFGGLGAASSSLEAALLFTVFSFLGSTCLGAAGLIFAGEVGGVVLLGPFGSFCLGAAGLDFTGEVWVLAGEVTVLVIL